MARKKKIKKDEKIIKEEIKAEETDVGLVLPLTADENNPVSDGLEFVGGDKDE